MPPLTNASNDATDVNRTNRGIAFGVGAYFLWGIVPGQPGISWQGHLFGALGGVVAARVVSRSGERSRQ